MTREHWKAFAASTGRTLLATVLTAIGAVYVLLPEDQRDFTQWNADDLKAFGVAVLGALVKMAIDWFRKSNTAFGRGAVAQDQDGGEGA